jgi:hypothetical protein
MSSPLDTLSPLQAHKVLPGARLRVSVGLRLDPGSYRSWSGWLKGRNSPPTGVSLRGGGTQRGPQGVWRFWVVSRWLPPGGLRLCLLRALESLALPSTPPHLKPLPKAKALDFTGCERLHGPWSATNMCALRVLQVVYVWSACRWPKASV